MSSLPHQIPPGGRRSGSGRWSRFAGLSACVCLLGFGVWWTWLYPVQTTIRWKEHIRMADAEASVQVAVTYQRRSRSINLFDAENLFLARKEVSFEAAPGRQVVLSSHEDIVYLGRFGSDWYAVLYGENLRHWPDEPSDRWGRDFNVTHHRLAKLNGTRFEPVAWEEAPAGIRQENLVRVGFYLPEFARWSGRSVSLEEKASFYDRHRNPGMYEIARPIRLSR